MAPPPGGAHACCTHGHAPAASRSWCGPCKMILPELQKMNAEYREAGQAHIVKLNCSKVTRRGTGTRRTGPACLCHGMGGQGLGQGRAWSWSCFMHAKALIRAHVSGVKSAKTARFCVIACLRDSNQPLVRSLALLCWQENKDLGKELNVRVAPTFHLYRGRTRVGEMTGAKVDKLKELIAANL